MRKNFFPYRAVTSRKGALTRFMKVMREWDPNDISKLKERLIYTLLLSPFPAGLSPGLKHEVLSADSIKNTSI